MSDLWAQYRSIGHRHPVVNGYSGYFPPHYPALKYALAQKGASALPTLAALGVRHVVVFHDRDPGGEWRDYVASHPDARVFRSATNQTHYLLPAAAAGRRVAPDGGPLRIASVATNVEQKNVGTLADGDLRTRWSTGRPQMAGNSSPSTCVPCDSSRGWNSHWAPSESTSPDVSSSRPHETNISPAPVGSGL